MVAESAFGLYCCRMRNILIILAYDGTGYHGWQRLPRAGRAIQGIVEESLARVLDEPVDIIGAGRTDAGVHAEGQAANFHFDGNIPAEELPERLNAALPGDIACRSAREVPERFHARYWAVFKTYRYRLLADPIRDPFARRFSLHVPDPLDVPAMEAAAAEFIGTRDFSAFANHKGNKKGFERTLESVRVSRNGPFVDILFTANGFLYNQARIMAQTLIEAGLGRLGPREVRAILAGKDRSVAPGAAPPQGLCLAHVEFRAEDSKTE